MAFENCRRADQRARIVWIRRKRRIISREFRNHIGG